ncbi:MAG: glycosyltransferase [Magnetococcales bacterium]|nr:glycosyltransferase [Magnetococcales bacterium]
MKHIYQFATNPVCSPYRLDMPRKILNNSGDFKITCFSDITQKEFDEIVQNADIVVIQRAPLNQEFKPLLDGLIQAGKFTVYEIDDDLMHLNPESRYAKQAPVDYGQSIEAFISSCHAVQCSTLQLAERIRPLNSEVAVITNQLEHIEDFIDKRGQEGPVIIGYAAGLDHYQDWYTIQDEYNRAIAELEAEGVRVETWIVGDHDIFNSITSTNKRFFPLLSRNKYMDFLKKLNISLCILGNSFFNLAKSDVKYLESSASSSAVIASNTVYGTTIIHEKTGLLFETPQEFGQQLKKLAKDQNIANKLATNAYNYVKNERLVSQHINAWADLYNGWCARKNEIMANHYRHAK